MNNELNLTTYTYKDLRVEHNRDLNYQLQCDVYSGDTYQSTFDFSVYTGATMEVRVKYNDVAKVLSFSSADNSIVLGDDGLLRLVKTASMMNVRSGAYVYDLILSNSDYEKKGFMKGKFIIEESVTR
jgi:hypothetical protein